MAHSHDMDFDGENGSHKATVARLHVSQTISPGEDTAQIDEPAAPARRRAPWERAAAQMRFWSRTVAIIFLCCFMVGWPVGMSLSAWQRTGVFSVDFGITFPILAIVGALAALIVITGQMLALSFRMIAKAEELESSATRLATPDAGAAVKVRSVGQAVHGEINALNDYLDSALGKLASAESMIRQQVQAIDTVGNSLGDGGSELGAAVAREREKLIELTEMMNSQADAFAEAIAEKARIGEQHSKNASERLSSAETELENRLSRLEETAERALKAFETLAGAFDTHRRQVEQTGETFDARSREAVEKSADVTRAFEQNSDAISSAQARLQEESERLEQLISLQRDRADRLAEAIAAQTEKIGALSEKRAEAERRLEEDLHRRSEASTTVQPLLDQPPIPTPATSHNIREERHSTAWRDILAAAETPTPPPAPVRSEATPNGKEPLRLQQVEPSGGGPAGNDGSAGNSAPGPSADGDIVWMIRQMQSFMVEIETRLYGRPAAGLLTRYKNGERNIFANSLLQRAPEDFTRRLRNQVDDNEVFERSVFEFLANFDALLEPDDEDEDQESLVDDYLGSPLGQVYVLIGGALEYFD